MQHNNDETASERNATPQEEAPQECTGGCGFFGRPETQGMCSKCFKDVAGKTPVAYDEVPAPAVVAPAPAAAPEPAPEVTAAMDTEPEPEPPAEAAPMKCLPVGAGGGAEKPSGSVEKKKKKNRCGACRKKVGLTGFDCKCGGLFCGLHRMASGHNCTFDHAAASKELLEGRLNSVIGMSEKFEKI